MPANRVVHVIDDDAAVRQSLAFLLSTRTARPAVLSKKARDWRTAASSSIT